jgi:hypothetical protein
MQSHGLSMTPLSVKQLRASLQQNSIRTQQQSETKLDGSLKKWCKLKVDTNKHEDFNLMFTNHGKEDEIYHLRTKYTL